MTRKGGEGMRLSYGMPEPDEEMKTVASKIVKLLIDSKMTYKKASETLETAQTLLAQTKPSVF